MEPDDQNHLQFLIEKHPPVAGDWGDWWELGTKSLLNHFRAAKLSVPHSAGLQSGLDILGFEFDWVAVPFLFFLAEHMHTPSLKQQKSHINFIVFFFLFFLFSSIIVDVLPIF